MKPTMIAPSKGNEKVPLPEVVTIPMMTAPSVTEVTKPKWSWCHVSTSIFATLCCAPSCGIIGLVYAVLSYVDHKSVDYGRSAKKRRHGWGWTIASIVFGLLMWALLMFVLVKSYMHYKEMMHVTNLSREMNAMRMKDVVYPEGKKDQWSDSWKKDVDEPMFGGDDHDFKGHGKKPHGDSHHSRDHDDDDGHGHHSRDHDDDDHKRPYPTPPRSMP